MYTRVGLLCAVIWFLGVYGLLTAQVYVPVLVFEADGTDCYSSTTRTVLIY